MSRLVLNQLVKGRKGSYQVIKSLAQNVYQANIEGTQISVVIKTAPDAPKLFINEVNTYHYDCVTKSPYIRSLREYISNDVNHCLVLEWIDNTLWETKEGSIEAKAKVFKTVAKSCLKALAVFEDMNGTGPHLHADLNPNNILVSGLSSPTPMVKLSDLGWTTRVGSIEEGVARIQGDAIRAPEIWKGASPSPACDIWSLGVSINEAGWCIAKLHKLRGAKLEGPIDDRYVMEWAIANELLSRNLVLAPTLRKELEHRKVPSECIAFIEHLLVVDPKQRPSVAEALAHPSLRY